MRILVTGGTGSLGHALVPKLLTLGHTPVILSRDEYKQSLMKAKFPDALFGLGDVCDEETVRGAVSLADAVIHTASLKQISTGEDAPWAVIRVNLLGSKNVGIAAHQNHIPAVLISSDKAVYPINVYGMTKALSEKFFLRTGLSVVRYGNVLGSRGSLLEIVDDCVTRAHPIPITDRRMTRFWWSIDEAADFVIEHMLTPGLHIPDLNGRSVVDVIEERAPGHPTIEVGIRPGEKMHERLETLEENPESKDSAGRR